MDKPNKQNDIHDLAFAPDQDARTLITRLITSGFIPGDPVKHCLTHSCGAYSQGMGNRLH
jgi:hypothetical protein